jgi:pimeloyl-ACP methyl ester carboxylesterase
MRNTIDRSRFFDDRLKNIKVIDGVEILRMKAVENSENKNQVVFAPGWSRTIPTFEKSLEILHNLNRDITTLNHPRYGGSISVTGDNFIDTFPKEVKRRATSLTKAIETSIAESEKSVDIIAQSMGCTEALLAVLMLDNFVKNTINNIVLVAPIGIVGKESKKELKKKFFKKQIAYNKKLMRGKNFSSEARFNASIAGSNFKKQILLNPRRMVAEFNSMENLEIIDLIKSVASIANIKIAIIQGVDDLMTPLNQIKFDKLKKGGFVNFIAVKGGHNEIYLNPEKYMALAEDILTSLENGGKK